MRKDSIIYSNSLLCFSVRQAQSVSNVLVQFFDASPVCTVFCYSSAPAEILCHLLFITICDHKLLVQFVIDTLQNFFVVTVSLAFVHFIEMIWMKEITILYHEN